jgi:hypothetical protein
MKPKSKANKTKAPTTVGSGDLLGHRVIAAPSKKEWDRVARENSKALESLPTSKLLVDVSHGIIPAKRREKGMPIRRCYKTMAAALSPNRNNRAGKTGGTGASL